MAPRPAACEARRVRREPYQPMARPQVEFVQSQAVAWDSCRWPHLAGCQAKLLSRDDATGAATAVVRFPAGWAAPGAGSLDTVEELYVLEGSVDLGGRLYEADCYGYLPAGFVRRSLTAPSSAVALLFFAQEPRWSAAGAQPAGTATPRADEFHDAYEMAWQDAVVATGCSGQPCTKLLHGSPHVDRCTMLVASPPQTRPPRWLGPQELHACATELFLLSGDLLSPTGLMSSGAYLWRPAGTRHGPYGSRGGSLVLVRTEGGPLTSELTLHEVALAREPSYQPLLPATPDAPRASAFLPQRY
jgi:hypothetical protein